MRTYSEIEVASALEACGVRPGRTYLTHSSLMHLGRLQGGEAAAIPARLYAILRELIGAQGTIVVPTFTFAFCRGEPFDMATSPSVGMGAFAEYVRLRPDARRSPHPMQPVAAIGPAADAICAAETRSSFDPGGAFATLLDTNADGLLLGAPMQSFSLVHLAEERCAVPYRYWKEFTGPYGRPPVERSFAMYVRDLELDPRLDLSRIESALEGVGAIRKAPLGAGLVKSFRLRDFLDVTMAHLEQDPTWLLEE